MSEFCMGFRRVWDMARELKKLGVWNGKGHPEEAFGVCKVERPTLKWISLQSTCRNSTDTTMAPYVSPLG